VSPLVITHYSGTGFGVVLGMETVLSTLTVLEGLYFIHLNKKKQFKDIQKINKYAMFL
jgi:hypothetical protein